MKELRATESLPREIEETVQHLISYLGFDPKEISRRGWNYNPRTGYFRFYKFLLDENGSREHDTFKGDAVTVRKVRKLNPFWRNRLEFVFQKYQDDPIPAVPR